MTTERIKRGETFSFSAEFEDATGDPVVIDDTWQVALRICKEGVGGETAADPTITIAGGTASGSFDTETLEAGVYYYDIRVTDPDGNDDWSEPIKLVIEQTNTPYS